MTTDMATQSRERVSDKAVLLVIATGLIAILILIVSGLFWASGAKDLPNWAENVLVAISTAVALKLGDALSTLVALSTGRHVERLGTQLAATMPAEIAAPPPQDAVDAANMTADATVETAHKIEEQAA